MSKNVKKLTLAAMFLALGLVLPFITGNIPAIGQMLSPMHIPVLLCGFVCGPAYGMAVGMICPVLRSFMFGMPVLFPGAVCMAFELLTYGYLSGFFFKNLKMKSVLLRTLISLIVSMIIGRVVYGIVLFIIFTCLGNPFSINTVINSTIIASWPGILLQIVLIPSIVVALYKSHKILNK